MTKDNNIFDELENYLEIYDRPTPIKYDLLKLSDEHRKLDALLRRYWEYLHPLSRDLFTSFANEFQYLSHQYTKMEKAITDKNEEIEKVNADVSAKLKSFEKAYENRLIDGVANINSKKLDELSSQNKFFRTKISELEEKLIDKEDINKSLRAEINMLIDDSDDQIKSSEQLEKNIQASISNFTNLSSQLEVFETEIDDMENYKFTKNQQISDLENELKNKDELKDELIERYRSKLKEIETKYIEFKSNVQNISPNIEKMNTHLKATTDKNKLLEIENNQLVKENEELKISLSEGKKPVSSLLNQIEENEEDILRKIMKINPMADLKDVMRTSLRKTNTKEMKIKKVKKSKDKGDVLLS